MMTLEDHVGDIIRKGRLASNTPSQAAAQAAGLSESELGTLEETGKVGKTVNFIALAQAVGLNGAKLEKIAKGWLPASPDLSLWRELRVIASQGDGTGVNCYLVWDEVTRDAALFDTGFDADAIFKLINDNGLTLRHLFLTHLHHDHIAAMEAVRARYPKCHLHANSSSYPPQHRNRANDFIQLGSLRISNRETPGHSEEGASYVIGNWSEDAPCVVVVGDALFAGSIGRGNQSWDLAKQKVCEQLLSLPAETLVCPGHGPLTSVGEEKANNPFF
jgi:hydroxyacylglutathione hydrolase